MTTQAREMFRFRNSPTLFLTVTNNCNMSCPNCYSLYKENKDEVAELGSMIDCIDKIAPGKLVITGGEPLIYPSRILSLINYYRADYRQHWDITLCTNLCFTSLNDKQLEVIKHCDYVQTTFSKDRFNYKEELFNRFKDNITTIKNLKDSEVKKLDCIVTLTRDQVENMDYKDLVSIIESLDIDGVLFEQFSFIDNKDELFSIPSFYKVSDEYMLQCCREIKDKELLNFTNWSKALDNNMTLHCTVCDSGFCKVFNVDANSVKNGCTCYIPYDKHERQIKFKTQCIQCEYFKYCRMDCERFGRYCAFPKKTFKYFLDNIYKKEDDNTCT